MKKGAIGIVEELAEQGYSIKESLAVLAEAKQRVKNIRKFAEEQSEGILLKDATRQQEEFIEKLQKESTVSCQQLEELLKESDAQEELLKESDAQFEAMMKKYLEHNQRQRFVEDEEMRDSGALNERLDLQEV